MDTQSKLNPCCALCSFAMLFDYSMASAHEGEHRCHPLADENLSEEVFAEHPLLEDCCNDGEFADELHEEVGKRCRSLDSTGVNIEPDVVRTQRKARRTACKALRDVGSGGELASNPQELLERTGFKILRTCELHCVYPTINTLKTTQNPAKR